MLLHAGVCCAPISVDSCLVDCISMSDEADAQLAQLMLPTQCLPLWVCWELCEMAVEEVK